jgi:flagellar motor switch protein FliN
MSTENPTKFKEHADQLETRAVLDLLRPFRTVPMEISIELGRGTLKLRDLLGLQFHSVFALDQHAGAKLNVYVNGVLLGKAEPVVVDDRIGIKIDEILDTER